MKHIGNLKKQVEKAETKDEKKSLIENAGMLLNDDELEKVAGGGYGDNRFYVMEDRDVDCGGAPDPPPPLSPFGSVSDSYEPPV